MYEDIECYGAKKRKTKTGNSGLHAIHFQKEFMGIVLDIKSLI